MGLPGIKGRGEGHESAGEEPCRARTKEPRPSRSSGHKERLGPLLRMVCEEEKDRKLSSWVLWRRCHVVMID